MKLTHVTICGFRSVEVPTSVLMGQPTLLAGHNDAGKSAVIDAIAFLLESYKILERDRTFAGTSESGEETRVDETWVGIVWFVVGWYAWKVLEKGARAAGNVDALAIG